jgi:ribosome-binding factor A
MSRRTERIGSLMRSEIAGVVLSKLSDPRIDPARTSVTRVEVPEDLLTARVYISVLGTAGEQRRTLEALRHAAGRIQELMMRQVRLKTTPVLEFELDESFKNTLETLKLIDRAMKEIRQKEQEGKDPAQRESEQQDSVQ